MGAKTAISVEQYLRTTFPDVDREYRDGEILNRTMPDYLHAKTQLILGAFFLALKNTLRLYPCSELRLRLSANTFLIPDICVFHPEEPALAVPDQPPLIVIEILSPDDRMSEVRAKLGEFKAWGVPHVWLVDPHGQLMYTCDQGLAEVPSLRVAELNLEITASDIFA
jgi:Uma2 family endonuclease